MEAVETSIHYSEQSGLADGKLQLSTARNHQEQYPYFFQGQIKRPEILGACLKALASVVGNRFFTPPAMLARLIAESDPVITCGNEVLRFEGFSACCGVYARVDLNPETYSGVVTQSGATNVDFNPEMLRELSRIRGKEQISLAVGQEEFILLKDTDSVVEKKVKLPQRWIKGFLAVQASQARMVPRLVLNKVEATRLVRSFPKHGGTNHQYWITRVSTAVRVSKTETKEGIPIGGIGRLHLLHSLLPKCQKVEVFSDPESDASAWVVDLNGYIFTLVLSPEVWRGFSGEGAGLSDLAIEADENLQAELLSTLKWQSEIDPSSMATFLDVSVKEVEQMLPILGNQGLLGFDLLRQAYFHRELPFNVKDVDRLNPRLKGARKLIEQGKVEIESHKGSHICSRVAGSGVEHRVEIRDQNWSCTCLWYAKHQQSRGPCKHVLATRILTQKERDA